MSEVSLEVESEKASAEDPQMDCEEADEAGGSLSEDQRQASVDGSDGGEDRADVLYDIDINSDGENAESSGKDVREEDGGTKSALSRSVDSGGREAKRHAETTVTPEESGDSHSETKVIFNFTSNNPPALALPRCALACFAFLIFLWWRRSLSYLIN